MNLKRGILFFFVSIFIYGCNLIPCPNCPDLPEERAKEFLASKGVSKETIIKFTERGVLSSAEAESLEKYNNTDVLMLLGRNSGTPVSMLQRLAKNSNKRVRGGVASNENAPLELLLSLRTPGEATTENWYLVQNDKIPTETLLDMYKRGEAPEEPFYGNSNCPVEILRQGLAEKHKDSSVARYAPIFSNPNLPLEFFDIYKKSENSQIRECLAGNSNIPDRVLRELMNDKDEGVRFIAQRNHEERIEK